MRTTIPKLRRMIRKVITEARYEWMNNPKGSGFPFTQEEWAATDQAEKDAYMEWAFGDEDDDGLRGDESDEPYDQERVNRMIMFLDDIYGSLSRTVEFEYNPDRVFHKLQGEFPDASEEEIAEAMDSYGQSLY